MLANLVPLVLLDGLIGLALPAVILGVSIVTSIALVFSFIASRSRAAPADRTDEAVGG